MDIELAMQNLRKHGFDVTYFDTKEQAADYLNKKIDNKSIGFGGSVTLKEMGLFRMLQSHNDVIDRTVCKDADKALLHDANAQVYICSANGVSQDGHIINIDGIGNRVAATLYGKEEVYLVVGVNKFAETFEGAIWRARNIASPKNAKRLGRKTPCAVLADKCYDCSSPERICRGFTVMERPLRGVGRYEIVVVNETLGY